MRQPEGRLHRLLRQFQQAAQLLHRSRRQSGRIQVGARRLRIPGVEGQPQKALAALGQELVQIVGELRCVQNAQQLDVVAPEHDAVIRRAPAGVPAARRYGEPQPPPCGVGRLQVVNPDQRVVDRAQGAAGRRHASSAHVSMLCLGLRPVRRTTPAVPGRPLLPASSDGPGSYCDGEIGRTGQ